jgi:hypothetical protein
MRKAPKQKIKSYQDGGPIGSKKMTPEEWDVYNKSKGYTIDPRNPKSAKGYGNYYDPSQILINPSKAHESGYEIIGKAPGAVDAFGSPLASAFSAYSYTPPPSTFTPTVQKKIVTPIEGRKPLELNNPGVWVNPNDSTYINPLTNKPITPVTKKDGGMIKGYANGSWVNAQGQPLTADEMTYSDADKALLGYKQSGGQGFNTSQLGSAALSTGIGALSGLAQNKLTQEQNPYETYSGTNKAVQGGASAALNAAVPGAGTALGLGLTAKDTYQSKASEIDPTTGKYIDKDKAKRAGLADVALSFTPIGMADTLTDKSLSWKDKGLSLATHGLFNDTDALKSAFQNKDLSLGDKLKTASMFGNVDRNEAKWAGDVTRANNLEKSTENINEAMRKRAMGEFADGGKITGKGGPKSDDIKAKMKSGSFIVPAENADKAEMLREKVLKKAPNKKANLQQKGGVDVMLSNGEHAFSPEEVAELKKYGYDVDALAPNSDDKKAMKSGGLTPEKAKTMLRDNQANGKPLTPLQKRYFGFIAGGGHPHKAEGGLLYSDGGRVRQKGETTQQYVARMKELDKQEASKQPTAKRAPVKTKQDQLPDLATRQVLLPNNEDASGAGGLLGQEKQVPLSGAGQITSREVNEAAVDSPQTVIPKTTKEPKVDWMNVLEYGAAAGQIALGLNQLGKSKRPVYSMDKTFESNVNKALANAQFGYTPQQQFLLDQQNQGLTNAGRFSARNLSGGNAASALANERSVLNDAFTRDINAVVGGQQLQQSKQARADALLADKMAIQRQIFSNSLNAFNQKQQSGSALLGAGIRNIIGANRVQQELAAQEKAANLSNSWMGNI